MRSIKILICISVLCFSTTTVFAQEKPEKVILKKDFEIQKHTIMERFEPGYVISAQKRAIMKMKRIKNAEYTLGVLDTMKISSRKRKQLLHDLKYNPLSERLNKFIVESKFDDTEEVVHQQN